MSQQGTFNVAQIQAVRPTRGKQQLCVCNRPLAYVTCQTCGTTMKNRVNKACAVHPGVSHLMDMAKCPKCYSSSLLERNPASDVVDRR